MTPGQKIGLDEFRQIVRQLIGLTAWNITGVGGTAVICSAQFGAEYKHCKKIEEHTLESAYGDFSLNIYSSWKILVQDAVTVTSKPNLLQMLTIRSVSGLWTLDNQVVQDVVVTDELDLHLSFADGQTLQVVGKLKNPSTDEESKFIGWWFSSKTDIYAVASDTTVTVDPYER